MELVLLLQFDQICGQSTKIRLYPQSCLQYTAWNKIIFYFSSSQIPILQKEGVKSYIKLILKVPSSCMILFEIHYFEYT